jgi:hypothetical protein
MSEENTVVEAVQKKTKKLSKSIEGTALTITEHETGTVVTYDFSTLPGSIQSLLGPFGLASKLGDAAAGKKGQDAVDAINKVWEGLVSGNWSVRAPAAEKISKNSIMEKFNAMPEGKEKKLTESILKNLGILPA